MRKKVKNIEIAPWPLSRRVRGRRPTECRDLSVNIGSVNALKLTIFRQLLSGGYNYDSTAIRPLYDHTTSYVTTGLLHCDLNNN